MSEHDSWCSKLYSTIGNCNCHIKEIRELQARIAELEAENARLQKENIQFKDAGTFALTILKSIRSDHYSAISDANNDSITMYLEKYRKDTE